MKASYTKAEPAERIAARFLCEYHKIWQNYFPGLNKRAHWHVMFSARRSPADGISCRTIHRALYGSYGTDIRTCIERVKDCEGDGFIKVLDASSKPCATDKLHENFDRHCRDTIGELCAIFSHREASRPSGIVCDDGAISALFHFFSNYDEKWRATCEGIVKGKGLTPAHVNDAMDHLVTYQYWAIVMLLWSASPFASDDAPSPALVIDEINSRMWDVLRLGHLAIKERVSNLIRWGFFAEQTIKKHKAVALTPVAGPAISKSLVETEPVLRELYLKLVPQQAELVPIAS
jgi:hypothetical protein